jgi:hypothetical protein
MGYEGPFESYEYYDEIRTAIESFVTVLWISRRK